MGKIIAIDYGTKRTGLAATDDLQIIASGLTTVDTSTLLAFLKEYIQKEKVDLVIIGEPKKVTNVASNLELEIATFIQQFSSLYPSIPVKRIDERFTSKMAFQTMIDGGLSRKKRQDKALVDQISATIILQSYLYYQ